jgi:endonuclease/exonuclease/phosphatase family metal-dependent hydrolase
MANIQDYLNLIKNAIYGKDVRQAIHDGIQQCYYDGKAGSTDLEARQRLDSAEGSISSLGSRMSTAENDIDVLDSRVDQIVAPSGEAPSAAEVTDARIGADGVIYSNLGDAVRTQSSDLKVSLDAEKDGGYYWLSLAYTSGGYINGATGEVVAYSGWKYTDYIDISDAEELVNFYISTITQKYCAFYNSSKTFISAFGNANGEVSVPTDAKYVRLSCSDSDYIKLGLLIGGYKQAIADSEKEIRNIKYLPYFADKYVSNTNINKGEFSPSVGWSCSDYIPVPYTGTLHLYNCTRASVYNAFYDVNKKYISMFSLVIGDNDITIPSNAVYYAVSNQNTAFGDLQIVMPYSYQMYDVNNKYIKVATYNVGLFNNGLSGVSSADAPQQMIKFRKIIGGIDADVINTQEFNEYFDTDNTYIASENVMDFKYPFNTKRAYTYGSVGFSKYPISNPTRKVFNSGSGRYFIWYEALIGTKIVTIIDAHLAIEEDPSIHRASEISELITFMNTKDYVILTGDFNAASKAEFNAFKTAGYTLCNGGNFGWFDTWPVYANMPSGWATSWPCNNLDNIIVSSNITPQYVETIECAISDHAPLVAELRIN